MSFSPAQSGLISGSLIVTGEVTGASTTVALTDTRFSNLDPLAGLDFYLPFTGNYGTSGADMSGNTKME